MSPELERLVTTYYRVQAGTAAGTAQALTRLWAQMVAADIDGSWALISRSIAEMVAAGQVRSAAAPQLFLERLLLGEGIDPNPLGHVSPLAFAGYTSAGLDVTTVLDSTPAVLKTLIGSGIPADVALKQTLNRLRQFTVTEVQDAGRGSMEAQMRLEPAIKGYTRIVKSPACSRCIALAGRTYSKSTGFARHPRCDCQHVPYARMPDRVEVDPRGLFNQMSKTQQDAAFTIDGAKAVREGADISQVVNARYQANSRGRSGGMSSPGALVTTSGTTVRSAFGRAQRAAGTKTVKAPGARYSSPAAQRLSPQGVARKAGGDAKKYRELLQANGYLL